MKISAVNQLKGTVAKVDAGTVNAVVSVDLGGAMIHSLVSTDSVRNMGLTAGSEVIAIVKASQVLIGLGEVRVSARNCLPGRILSIIEGAVSDFINIEIAGGHVMTANVTRDSVETLGLLVGRDVTVIFKAMNVLLAVE